MMGQMKFQQINRILMDRFFSPSEGHGTAHTSAASKVKTIAPPAVATSAAKTTTLAVTQQVHNIATPPPSPPSEPETTSAPPPPAPIAAASPNKAEPATEENPLVVGAIDLIINETGIEASDLKDDTTFVQIGVDSLMSVVLVEKFKNILKMEIKSSLFIECETVGVFKEWLEENR